MAGQWKKTAKVKAGGLIEMIVPELGVGEEVEIIVRHNGTRPSPLPCNRRAGYGADRGLIVIRDDFDRPINDPGRG